MAESIHSEDSNYLEVMEAKNARLNAFGKLLQSEEHSDFKIIVGRHQLNVHKCVLENYDFFKNIFRYQKANPPTPPELRDQMEINDFSVDVIRIMLEFIYKGSVTLDIRFMNNIVEVLKAADKVRSNK